MLFANWGWMTRMIEFDSEFAKGVAREVKRMEEEKDETEEKESEDSRKLNEMISVKEVKRAIIQLQGSRTGWNYCRSVEARRSDDKESGVEDV